MSELEDWETNHGFHCSESQQVSLDNEFIFFIAHCFIKQEGFDHYSSSSFLSPQTHWKSNWGRGRRSQLTSSWLHFPERR